MFYQTFAGWQETVMHLIIFSFYVVDDRSLDDLDFPGYD